MSITRSVLDLFELALIGGAQKGKIALQLKYVSRRHIRIDLCDQPFLGPEMIDVQKEHALQLIAQHLVA